MSQHYHTTIHDHEQTTILMGWDRPLQGFFMVIQKPSDKEDFPFFSNLSHSHTPHPQTLTSFLVKLDTLGISLPKKMIEELLQDKADNTGCKEIWHD